jgi:hypothetical protein
LFIKFMELELVGLVILVMEIVFVNVLFDMFIFLNPFPLCNELGGFCDRTNPLGELPRLTGPNFGVSGTWTSLCAA